MRAQRTGNELEGAAVSGLGVCDVWRLELSAVQWPWLLDELDMIRNPLEEALDRSREVTDEAERRGYDLRLIAMIRAQLPPIESTGPATVIGPSELLRDLVPGALRHVVDVLSDVVDAQRLNDPAGRALLLETAEAAYAWAKTAASCSALEAFSFDPVSDPLPVR